jgi:hypothetical protein
MGEGMSAMAGYPNLTAEDAAGSAAGEAAGDPLELAPND